MKSTIHAGNHKLRGRKCKHMRCGCCVVQDFREKVRRTEAMKEMAQCMSALREK